MPGGGSQDWALIAREVASSSHPARWFMACGVHGAPEPEQEAHGVARRFLFSAPSFLRSAGRSRLLPV
jgi:hypothetical protein